MGGRGVGRGPELSSEERTGHTLIYREIGPGKIPTISLQENE